MLRELATGRRQPAKHLWAMACPTGEKWRMTRSLVKGLRSLAAKKGFD